VALTAWTYAAGYKATVGATQARRAATARGMRPGACTELQTQERMRDLHSR
jgi:hypothetical protein